MIMPPLVNSSHPLFKASLSVSRWCSQSIMIIKLFRDMIAIVSTANAGLEAIIGIQYLSLLYLPFSISLSSSQSASWSCLVGDPDLQSWWMWDLDCLSLIRPQLLQLIMYGRSTKKCPFKSRHNSSCPLSSPYFVIFFLFFLIHQDEEFKLVLRMRHMHMS